MDKYQKYRCRLQNHFFASNSNEQETSDQTSFLPIQPKRQNHAEDHAGHKRFSHNQGDRTHCDPSQLQRSNYRTNSPKKESKLDKFLRTSKHSGPCPEKDTDAKASQSRKNKNNHLDEASPQCHYHHGQERSQYHSNKYSPRKESKFRNQYTSSALHGHKEHKNEAGILYKNSAFRAAPSSLGEGGDNKGSRAVKEHKQPFNQDCKDHFRKDNELGRRKDVKRLISDDLLLKSSETYTRNSKNSGNSRASTKSIKSDDLRLTIQSQIKLQKAMDHSIREGILSPPDMHREPIGRLASTGRTTKGSTVRKHSAAVNVQYLRQPLSPKEELKNLLSSGSKDSKPSQVTVISTKSGEDLRSIVRSQIRMQKLLDDSIETGVFPIVGSNTQICPKDKLPAESKKPNESKSPSEEPLLATSSLDPIVFAVSADDIVSSKVIDPAIRRIQRMYLNTLREEMSIMEYMERVPKMVSDVYKREAIEKQQKTP